MAYETMLITGLRYSELRSIRLGDCYLTDNIPHLTLKPQHEKNRKGSDIPVPTEFGKRLEGYRVDRIKKLAGTPGTFLPNVLYNKPLFDLPLNMVKTFNLDLAYANLVPSTITKDKNGHKKVEVHKIDAQGCTLDIHALRHPFCDRLVKSGVSVATAQKAMRYSAPRLTLGVYGHVGMEETSAVLNLLATIPKLHAV